MKKLLSIIILLLLALPFKLYGPVQQTIGVLPYALDKAGQVFLLFGKSFNGLLSTNEWSDFKGLALPIDATEQETAIRILSGQTRLVYGGILSDFKKHKLNANELNAEVKKAGAADVLDFSKLKLNKIVEQAVQQSVDNAKNIAMGSFLPLLKDAPKLKQDTVRGGSHTIYFIKVKQADINYFCGGPKVPGWEPVDFAWVNNDQLLGLTDLLLIRAKNDSNKAAENLVLPPTTVGCDGKKISNEKINISLARMLLSNDGLEILEQLHLPTPVKPKHSENLDNELNQLTSALS